MSALEDESEPEIESDRSANTKNLSVRLPSRRESGRWIRTLDELVEGLFRDGRRLALEPEADIVPVPVCPVVLLESLERVERGARQRAGVCARRRRRRRRVGVVIVASGGGSGCGVGAVRRVERVVGRDHELARLELGEDVGGELEEVQARRGQAVRRHARERVRECRVNGCTQATELLKPGNAVSCCKRGCKATRRRKRLTLTTSPRLTGLDSLELLRAYCVLQYCAGHAPPAPAQPARARSPSRDCPFRIDRTDAHTHAGRALARVAAHRRARTARPAQGKPETVLACVPFLASFDERTSLTSLLLSCCVLECDLRKDETATYDATPNTHVAPFDAALPGTLPVRPLALSPLDTLSLTTPHLQTLHPTPLRLALVASLALKADINPVSRFDRKHYFYPDLTPGWQITQRYGASDFSGAKKRNRAPRAHALLVEGNSPACDRRVCARPYPAFADQRRQEEGQAWSNR